MKVILNQDLSPLGEEGDVKDVARGYARNYLFPRNIALPYTERTVKLFESRREEIEKRKEDKRKDAAGLKEKLESLNLEITMSAGANGKLYGAVTSQTVADELAKQGYQIERKRIELAGTSFKSIGKYKVTVKLYGSAAAEITVTVLGQEVKTEARSQIPARGGRRRREAGSPEALAAAEKEAVSGEAAAEAPPETPAETPNQTAAEASAETALREGGGETPAGEE
ncbi:MAG: 50S ribosomal protein L9 [Treponema sp.]|jgi:large subunit ribosomal protein L9|nr:50S ribosomal protein L9 [Treponema sp.]